MIQTALFLIITTLAVVALNSDRAESGLPPPQGKSVNGSSPGWPDMRDRLSQRKALLSSHESQEKKPIEIKKKNRPILQKLSTASSQLNSSSNLPSFHWGVDRRDMKASDRVVFVPQNADVRMGGVTSGDLFYAVIEQRLKVSPGVPTPIRAIVLSGTLKGGIFLGDATLDRELKRILLTFTKVRRRDGRAYRVKAVGLSYDGSIGLEGEYHSQAGAFLVAELASATAAGFLDSTISRSQNSMGNYVQEPSLLNSGKTGAVTALSRSADRLAEQVKQAPEYTDSAGFQNIRIIVQDDPMEFN